MKTWQMMLSLAVVAALATGAAAADAKKPAIDQGVKQGELRVQMKDGSIVSCPLKHTDVKANIAGFIARVKVRQTFYNPLNEKIEAVYVFPLPHEAAVDDMTMIIGDRRIVGMIKRRDAARVIYERALARGQTAALLEQERPNIFTQSVGNIKPKQVVVIEISYVDVLKYDLGVYDFHFPMVVGPRFIPGAPTSKVPTMPPELRGKVGTVPGPVDGPKPKGDGWSPDTDRVPDASRITPPVLKPGFRNGHDISLAVELDAGVPVQDLQVKQHRATVKRHGRSKASIRLDKADSIPNKDFILRYAVVGKKPELAVLAHATPERGGYFMLMVQPREDERLKKTPPRELFFLVDVSGSMSGRPIAQVRVVTFAGSARELFDKPQPIDDKSLTTALEAVKRMRGGGGTHMLKGIVKCLDAPADPKRVRIVIMMTDGYIGNEAEIIREVGRRCGDRIRFWAIGVGTSVNRYLIDGVAKQGHGMSKILGLNEDPQKLVAEVVLRIHRAQLTGIRIDWGGLAVYETYPAKVPELWSGRPVILFGRYRNGGKAVVRVNGKVEGEAASFPVKVELPAEEPEHDVLAKVWARKKIEELTAQNIIEGSAAVVEMVTQLALDYRLMSRYTSFVAVDEKDADKLTEPARPPRRMLVPVPLPEGVSFAGVFGPAEGGEFEMDYALKAKDEKFELAKSRGRFAPAPTAPRPMAYASTPALTLHSPGPPMKQAEMKRAPGALSRRNLAYRGGRARYGRWGGKGGGGPAGAAKSLSAVSEVLRDEANVLHADIGGARYGFRQVFAGDLQKCVQEAKKALAAGKELAKKGEATAARAQFQLAYMLDTIAARYYYSRGQTGGEALAEIARLTEKVKGLDRRLDLLIRNQSLESALAAVSKAAGIEVSVLPGSVDDAKSLLRTDRLRVTYLDLRGATVKEALGWMLSPLRLAWEARNGRVVIGTARRTGGPWVYDVQLLALPGAKEFEGKNWRDRTKLAKQAGDEFLAAVKTVAPSALWYAPGQVLVFGRPKVHDAVAKLLADLADPKAKLAGAAAKVHKAASARYAARKAAHEKWLAALGRARVAGVMNRHGWSLLAAALDGRINLESLTELQAAWADPKCAELLDRGSFAAVRSAWIIGQTARLLPRNRELLALVWKSFRASSRAVRKALADASTNQDGATFVKALYVAMAADAAGMYKDPKIAPEFWKGREALITARDKDPLEGLRVLARALLLPPKDVDAKAVQALLDERLRGDDMVVLAALAARRLGGDTWDTFRANARDILGKQPLSGSVIVLVNNLAGATELTLAQR